MKIQQLHKLIREIILSEVESTTTDKSAPPTNTKQVQSAPPTDTKQVQGQIKVDLFKKLGVADFDSNKFSTTINLVKQGKSLNMAANKALADVMVAMIKTSDDNLLNQIFANLKQIEAK